MTHVKREKRIPRERQRTAASRRPLYDYPVPSRLNVPSFIALSRHCTPQFQLHATYEGNYTDGKKAGTGKMTYPNGDIYTGEWKDNMMDGEGTYVYKVCFHQICY